MAVAATVFGWRQGEGHGPRDGANSGFGLWRGEFQCCSTPLATYEPRDYKRNMHADKWK